ncbi:CDP-alcohol phosphatidyltransferase family protein [Amaricoccus sp.]|uniref:CDP-alcohol phosphatidyltransferase family protein n=1 Tax=Amaricoccus sp. TaxID=1872485 RepID=UPI001B6EA9DA|nr:CDP-alcohol phosphatidyltransferase family protein [Amaricoccus sp.]MBP7001326.1 CDP-alcohol phosphatidyltransferase family protein [Amaricoccus sp.]
MSGAGERRPLASRRTRWARAAAGALTRAGASPDAISAAGIVAAGLACAALAFAPERAWLWLVGAVLVQLRLAANLLDGMVAIEGGRGGPVGALWNEAPDRVEDTAILVGFGIAVGAYGLGLWAAVAALFTAYVRVLGGTLGLAQSFAGPMAKQHRMAAVTLGCVVGFAEAALDGEPRLARLILWAVFLGALATAARRLRAIARDLRARA